MVLFLWWMKLSQRVLPRSDPWYLLNLGPTQVSLPWVPAEFCH